MIELIEPPVKQHDCNEMRPVNQMGGPCQTGAGCRESNLGGCFAYLSTGNAPHATVRFIRPHARHITRTVSLHQTVICELISGVKLHLADLDVDGKIILKRLKELGWKCANSINLVRDRDRYRAPVTTVSIRC
jgi:hypothetical protein